MALKTTFKDVEFGIGDRVRVVQKIKEGGKSREAIFEGMVIGIKGRNPGKTFMVRRIGEAGIGIERIFPLNLPTIDKVIVVKRGIEGVKRAKLYYTREKAPTEVEMIFKKAAIRIKSGEKKTNKRSGKTG
ncbi:MAG TPA: 50S ribosomal protein L19 [Candidatus Saccharimonadales bacterium]|jgi:large subunit ribosomal protein L19|nr:50S ribosomal protein L19 [Candidatus Saccharimonadales bacterium]